MIVIGSKALIRIFHDKVPNSLERSLKSDYDVIMSLDEFSLWTKEYKDNIVSLYPKSSNKYKAIVKNDNGEKLQYEIELGVEGTSSKFLLDNQSDVCCGMKTYGFFGEEMNVMCLEFLLITKRSHLMYPVHFEKNMEDYIFLKQHFNCTYKNYDLLMKRYYDIRCAEAKERYKKFKTPKLNVTTENFFSSKLSVPTYFIHDHIHEVMKHNDIPVYRMMQLDNTKAWCEKDMFFELPYEYQVQCVQEEGYVIALERYIIPQAGDNCNNPLAAYKDAVKRICTTLTSGWFRDFAIENYDEVIKRFNPEFVDKFAYAYICREIKPKDGISTFDIPLFDPSKESLLKFKAN